MKIFGLAFANDNLPKYSKNPPHTLETSPSVRRIEACITVMRKIATPDDELHMVFGAGFTAESPLSWTPGAPKIPLCEQMAEYVREHHPDIIVTTKLGGYGSEAEAEHGMDMISRIAEHEKVIVVPSTNFSHRFRVRAWVWYYKRWGCKIIHAKPKHHFAWSCTWREIKAFPATLGIIFLREITRNPKLFKR